MTWIRTYSRLLYSQNRAQFECKRVVHLCSTYSIRHGDPCRYLRGPPPVSTHPVVGRASVGARARRLSSAPACVCVTRETRLSLVPLDAAVTPVTQYAGAQPAHAPATPETQRGLTRYCHYQSCMVYGIQKGGRGGVVYCAIDVHEYCNSVGNANGRRQ